MPFVQDPESTAQTLPPWASKHPCELRIKDGDYFTDGKTGTQKPHMCQGPFTRQWHSQKQDASKNNNNTFLFFFFLLLLNIFPAELRSSSQNFKKPKFPIFPSMEYGEFIHSDCNCFSSETTDWEEGQGWACGLQGSRENAPRQHCSCSGLHSLGLLGVLLGDSFWHVPTMWILNLGILINQTNIYWLPTMFRPSAVTE